MSQNGYQDNNLLPVPFIMTGGVFLLGYVVI